MKQGSTLFLKGVITLLGLAVLALGIYILPTVMSQEITGGYQPILMGMYVATIPFFGALYQGLKLLGFIDSNLAFSESSVKALKNIKICAITISGMFTLGMPYIYIVAERDDAPGVILIGLVIIFASVVIATFAALLQKLIQNAVDIKAENDLTV